LRKCPECNSGIRDLCGRRPLYLRNEGTTSGIYRRAIVLEIANQVVGTSNVFRKTRKWSLWRRRPPPKRKKKLQIQEGPVMWEHRQLHELQPPLLEVREREREENFGRLCWKRERKKTLDDYDNRTHWKLIRKLLGTSWP
jgi:hypothetical protein